MDMNSSTSPAIKDDHGGRYPDLILPRGNLSSELSRGAGTVGETGTASNVSLNQPSLQPTMVASSRPRRCNYCNENSSGSFGSCSCQGGSSRGDEGFSSGNSPSREKISSRDDVTVKMHGDTHSSEFVKPLHQDTEKLSGSNDGDLDIKYGRKWEYFPGKNKFYFDGRLMTAPSIRFCMLSFFLILLTFVLFTVFDGPFLARELTIAIPIIGSVLFILVIVNMIKTSCSDPGILPRASAQESEFIEKSYANPNGLRPPPRTKDIIVNGQTIKSKYCFTCKMFRPPRASHCGVCDNCVDRFDHHCPFLGNCIGKRNYRNFYTFVVSLSLLAVFVLCCSITKLALLGKERGNFLDALRDSPTSAIVILISFFGMWTVIGLAGFHTYLIAVEQTTNEDIKGMFGRVNTINPYTRGNFCQNCCFILCGPYQPSLIDSRGFVTPDFLASLPKKSGTGHDNPASNQCSLPPPSIRPHCGEGSNTPRSGGVDISGTQTMYQITALESGGHKLGSGSTTSPTGTGNPIGSHSKVFTSANQVASSRPLGSHYPKAGTVPESGMLNPNESNSHLTYQYGHPGSNQSQGQAQIQNQNRRNYFGSQSSGNETASNDGYNEGFHHSEHENYWAVALEGNGHGQEHPVHSKSKLNPHSFGGSGDTRHGHRDRDETEDMSMSMVHLDFPEYSSPPSLVRVRNGSRKEGDEPSVSTSISVPLISIGNSSSHSASSSKKKKREFNTENGASIPAHTTGINYSHRQGHGNNSGTMTNRRRTLPPPVSAAEAPVALAFRDTGDEEEDEVESLENLTMINSPLHLDSIS